MLIGGYNVNYDYTGGVTVKEYEAGWSFYLQGDDATQFRQEWANYKGPNFAHFLSDYDYQILFEH